jgi:plastocyanin
VPPRGFLYAATANSAADVWAAGDDPVDGGKYRGFTVHWDGTKWSTVNTPIEGTARIYSLSVAQPSGMIWAVGEPRTGKSPVMRLCPVKVTEAGFDLGEATIRFAETMVWKVPGANTTGHTVTDSTGLNLYDSGTRLPTGSYTHTFYAAGTYTVSDQTTGATSTVSVKPTVTNTPQPLHVRWASRNASAPLAYDVQVKRPGSSVFVDWRVAVSTGEAQFTPDAGHGVYAFQARLRHTNTGAATGWSPSASQTF